MARGVQEASNQETYYVNNDIGVLHIVLDIIYLIRRYV
jgi:hypothetical protein